MYNVTRIYIKIRVDIPRSLKNVNVEICVEQIN
jgi:hypothetical protein